jgi:hypothetical protein
MGFMRQFAHQFLPHLKAYTNDPIKTYTEREFSPYITLSSVCPFNTLYDGLVLVGDNGHYAGRDSPLYSDFN